MTGRRLSPVALWYLRQQAPLRDRLTELLADYAPLAGETTDDVIARMAPGDHSEALDLAAVIAPFGDASRRVLTARAAAPADRE